MPELKKMFEKDATIFEKHGKLAQVAPNSCVFVPFGTIVFPVLHSEEFPKTGAQMLVVPFYNVALAKEVDAVTLRAITEWNSAHYEKSKADPTWTEAARAFTKFKAALGLPSQ